MTPLTKFSAYFGQMRLPAPRRWVWVSFVLAGVLLMGCSKTGPAASSGSFDPEVQAHLAQLTHELHRTMVGRRLTRDFDEFVSLAKVDVPPPPEGKKYAINDQWKVILVDK